MLRITGGFSQPSESLPALATTASLYSLPGGYPIAISAGTLAAPDYSLNLANGSLTVLPTSSAPQSGSTCNGAHSGTFTGNVSAKTGQYCALTGGGITGNAQVSGGTLVVVGASATANSICGTTVTGDLNIQNNAAPIQATKAGQCSGF
jgi:hypothetical protein